MPRSLTVLCLIATLGATAKLQSGHLTIPHTMQLCKGAMAGVSVQSGRVVLSPFPGYNMSIQTGDDPKVQYYVVSAQKGHAQAKLTIDTRHNTVTAKHFRTVQNAVCVLPD